MLIPIPRATLVLVDGDTVEERNLLRQNFYPCDLGKNKAQALAERLSRSYSRPVAYHPFHLDIRNPGLRAELIVGCVDNPSGRKAIAQCCYDRAVWIDAGNGAHTGQVLVGNYRRDWGWETYWTTEKAYHLPLPSLQRPDLLTAVPVEELEELSCAQGMLLGGQSPVINHAMASLVLTCVHQLLSGTLDWMAAYLDLQRGWLQYVPITQEAMERCFGQRTRRRRG